MLPLKQSHSQSQSDANRSSPISTQSQMPNKEYKTQKHSQPNANEHVHSSHWSQSNSYVNKSLQSINSPTPTNNFRENKSIHTNHSQTSMKTYTIFALAVIRRQQFTKHNNTNSNSNSNSQAPTKTYSIRSHTSTTVYNALNPFTAGLVCTLCQGMFHGFLPYFNL